MAQNKPDDAIYKDESWLREQYHDLGKTTPKIADTVGVCVDTIQYWMEKKEVERRDPSYRNPAAGDGRYRSKSFLEEQYVEKEKGMPEIADMCGVHRNAVRHWMLHHDIEIRENSEAISLAKDNNPEDRSEYDDTHGWRSSSKWHWYRHQTYVRDDYRCQWCSEEDVAFHAHHIIPVSDGGNKFDLENLITLCPDCHNSCHANNNEVLFA